MSPCNKHLENCQCNIITTSWFIGAVQVINNYIQAMHPSIHNILQWWIFSSITQLRFCFNWRFLTRICFNILHSNEQPTACNASWASRKWSNLSTRMHFDRFFWRNSASNFHCDTILYWNLSRLEACATTVKVLTPTVVPSNDDKPDSGLVNNKNLHVTLTCKQLGLYEVCYTRRSVSVPTRVSIPPPPKKQQVCSFCSWSSFGFSLFYALDEELFDCVRRFCCHTTAQPQTQTCRCATLGKQCIRKVTKWLTHEAFGWQCHRRQDVGLL
jgi:hypothetical protein